MPVIGLRVAFLTALCASASVSAERTVFERLVSATQASDWDALLEVLETETLSTSTISATQDNRLIVTRKMQHGVHAEAIAQKLQGCVIEKWRDVGSKWSKPFVLWQCPSSRQSDNECYFRVYRASMLDPRWHPENLFVHEMARRDIARCGHALPRPSQRD